MEKPIGCSIKNTMKFIKKFGPPEVVIDPDKHVHPRRKLREQGEKNE